MVTAGHAPLSPAIGDVGHLQSLDECSGEAHSREQLWLRCAMRLKKLQQPRPYSPSFPERNGEATSEWKMLKRAPREEAACCQMRAW